MEQIENGTEGLRFILFGQQHLIQPEPREVFGNSLHVFVFHGQTKHQEGLAPGIALQQGV
ncbi:hypothetical protein D3C76_1659400 [compost metagenome]